MHRGYFWLLVVLFITIFHSTQAQWTAPYFADPGTDGIVLGQMSGNIQSMSMDEEIATPFDFIIINHAGATQPGITFRNGDPVSFGPVLEQRDNVWVLRVTRRQDYETLNQQQYIIEVSVGTIERTIFCTINNLIDTPPIVTLLYEGPCEAYELEAEQDTECHVHVYDPDSLLNNELTHRIVGNNREHERFQLREIERGADGYSITYTLFVVEELKFEEREVYNFRAIFTDSGNNDGEGRIVVEVIDVPSLPPRWVRPFSTERFEEKTPQEFSVIAIDGDTGINSAIKYRLEFPAGQSWSNLITIGEDTGVISVQPINRDLLKQEVFTFTIVALKAMNESWTIEAQAVLIVDDVNDNYPEIDLTPFNVQIPESTYMQLPFTRFIINDIDLGPHATYSVEMLSDSEVLYPNAFTIIPNTGYQETSFLITVSNAEFLDYEDPIWRDFDLKIVATEVDFEEHSREQVIRISLTNWNDEVPEFEEEEYVVDVLETASANHFLMQVRAIDRDIDDQVFHSIIGTLGSDFSCSDDGEISISRNDVLDYEKQTTVIIQIQARDSLQTGHPGETLHTVYAQLQLRVLDVNDETPDLRMPRQAPRIRENSPANTVVTTEILATDPDTTADLEFWIDWENSYATKSGQEADRETYENCFIIEKHPETINRVFGHLKVNPEFDRDIDYEMYEVIYLTIKVEDRNQEINDGVAEAILTVRVEDENDNAPEFIEDTLTVIRSVVEEAHEGTLIGTIAAIDIDGPGNNVIEYSIEPVTEQGTTPGWVRINPDTGVIEVEADQAIDCDEPRLDYLEYIITLTDGVHTTTGNVKIDMIDTNNKLPQEATFEKEIYLYENASDLMFVTVQATDKDRDEPHNVVWYSIDYVSHPNLQNLFEINQVTGDLNVMLAAELDRDFGAPRHEIHIKYEDNYLGNGRRNSDNTLVTVILLDVNDNAPIMPHPNDFSPSVAENFVVGYELQAKITSTDPDEAGTPNSEVSYRILGIEPFEGHADPIPDIEGAFEIISDRGTNTGTLKVQRSLQGYYGTWRINIEAYDHGDEWDSQISLSSNQTYNLRIDPFNYETPRIVFPEAGNIIRLRFNDANVNSQLLMTNGVPLPPFEAEDSDGGAFGDVTFSLTGSPNGEDHLKFQFEKVDRHHSNLRITEQIESKTYSVNLEARDGGGNFQDLVGVRIIFIDIQGEPFFHDSEFNGKFTENTPGLEESLTLPEGEDPKNNGITNPEELINIYYFIYPESELFSLDPETRILTLKQPLNREEVEHHTINVIATNNRNGPVTWSPNSVLQVGISVDDINDNPPVFDREAYAVGITTSDFVSKALLTVSAHDPDTVDEGQLIYYILENTIESEGTNLEGIKNVAFTMEPISGVLRLNRAIDDTQTGYFQFKVEVKDSETGFGPHYDQTNIKVYIIAESNRVSFIFLNSLEDVREDEVFIKDIFTRRFGFETNIDEIERRSENDNQTVVRCHFIDNAEAVDGDIIRARIVDLDFIAEIQNDLTQHGLFLNGYIPTTPDTNNPEDSFQELLNIILIVVCAVLAVLCVVLGIAFWLRSRSLNRQLKALSTTNFGSVSSNLNRMGAPTTNIFATEGKNPALNNQDFQRDFLYDAKSIQSDDSDFVGIDKNPTFMSYGQKNSDTSNSITDFREKSLNPLANVSGKMRDDDYTRF
ncbi:fat-like cadherin-related tumor suppressor homolog [Sergentomyia squamirostris]